MKKLIALVVVAACTPIGLVLVASGPTASAQSGATDLARAEISADLLEVYVAASTTCPGLPWQVLAGIGWVESHHGQGRVDPATGDVHPPILGPAIDGRPGFAAITDPQSPDGWAHAVGPMQFLTTTFRAWAVLAPDRPPDRPPDANNAWDAIYTAAAYLCAGRDRLDDLYAAVLRYNHSERYYADVLSKAKAYGYGSGAPAGRPLASGSGAEVVRIAMTQLGVPYIWGGASPRTGFDCSGLVQWAYAQIGVNLPRTTAGQVNVGVAVAIGDLAPGDLVFTRSVRGGGVVVDRGHVAIYAGGGKVVVAPRTGDVVRLRSLEPAAVQALRRVVGPGT